MSWVAVDKDGSEYVYVLEPSRQERTYTSSTHDMCYIELPNGSIEKLIGRDLTWEDNPVELK